MKPPLAHLEVLYTAFTVAQDAGDFDTSRAAHIEYLSAVDAFVGVPQDAYIVLMYGKEALNVHSQNSPLAPLGTSTDNPAAASTEAAESLSTAPEVSATQTGESSARTDNRLTGTVKYWNAAKEYGYIRMTSGREFYFQKRNLRFEAMPIQAGDTVTFRELVTVSENAGMPKAADVMIEGYTPSVKPAYTPRADIVEKAREQKARERAIRQQVRKSDRERQAANEAALKSLFRGNQG